ncbi:hypothetical protein KCU61_g503, partial [Aureobasidium melanogenum]
MVLSLVASHSKSRSLRLDNRKHFPAMLATIKLVLRQPPHVLPEVFLSLFASQTHAKESLLLVAVHDYLSDPVPFMTARKTLYYSSHGQPTRPLALLAHAI